MVINTQTLMTTKHIQPAISIGVTIAIIIGVLGSLFLGKQAINMSNTQSCLNLAQTHTVTEGNNGNGKWSVQEVSVNNAVYQDCVSKKHL